MGDQISEATLVGVEPSRPLDAWPDDVDSEWPPDPATIDDLARVWAECNSDLARHLASMPEPPDSDGPPPATSAEFAEEAFSDGPNGAAAVLADIDPGSRSATLLAMLDPARVTPAAMVGVIAATEKLASWVQALQHRWLAAFTVPGVAAPREGLLAYASAPGQKLHRMARAADQSGIDSPADSNTGSGVCCGEEDLPWSGPTVHGDPELNVVIDEVAFKVAAAEVSAALHFSPMTAQRRVRQALDFSIDLPGTLQALSRGQIDRGRALTILDRTENLPVDLRHKVEAAVLPKARARTPGQLRGIVDRAVISVDPAAAKKRQTKAREERHVTVRPERDGMSTFLAELPAEQAGVAFSVLDRVATTLHRNRDEDRRIGALRADVFSDIFDQLATEGLVDLRATLGGRAVITDDPSRFSWVSDTATIAARFDPDTSLIDPRPDGAERPAADCDTGPIKSSTVDDSSLADAPPRECSTAEDGSDRQTLYDSADPVGPPIPASAAAAPISTGPAPEPTGSMPETSDRYRTTAPSQTSVPSETTNSAPEPPAGVQPSVPSETINSAPEPTGGVQPSVAGETINSASEPTAGVRASDEIREPNVADQRFGPDDSDRPNSSCESNSADEPPTAVPVLGPDVDASGAIRSEPARPTTAVNEANAYDESHRSSAYGPGCSVGDPVSTQRPSDRRGEVGDSHTPADDVLAPFGPTAPDQTGPDQTRPDQTSPDQTSPDQTNPDQTRRKAVGAIAVDPPGRGHTELCPPYDLADPGSDSGHSLTFDGAPNGCSTGRVPFVFATQQGRHTHLNVTIAATTLAGLDDLPGELDGHGPISADLCRALAASAASIAAVAVDTSCGTALDVGRTIYRPRLSHRDHVVQRDRTCRFPGCRQPARRCQIDHSEEFCSGGATCPCNLSCLCKFHHDLKTTGLWDAQQYPDASILWTSPTGRTYRTETPEWPIAAPKHQTRPSTSTVDDAESCNTGDARMPAGTKPTTPDEPPF